MAKQTKAALEQRIVELEQLEAHAAALCMELRAQNAALQQQVDDLLTRAAQRPVRDDTPLTRAAAMLRAKREAMQFGRVVRV